MRDARGKGQRDGMQTFGASAPLKSLLTEYGFTVEKVVAAARAQLAVAQS
jgi:transketolase